MNALENAMEDLRRNARQWLAFEAEGHCVVLAPPGSGKTKLLSTRLANDLLTKIPAPQGAACITLTNAAAEELRKRIRMLGVVNRPASFIGTVHSFALTRVVVPFAAAAGREHWLDRRIATKGERQELLDAAIRRTYHPAEDTRYVESTFRRFRGAQQLLQPRGLTPKVQRLIENFEGELGRAGLVDFDGIIQWSIELVERHEFVRRVLTARFPRIYVDEYQDLAPGLDRLVAALCFDSHFRSELFAVGDPDQSIFGFTGSRPELLSDLGGRAKVDPIHLNVNYRSGDTIIRVAQRMLLTPRDIHGVRGGGSVVAQHVPSGFQGQVFRASECILEESSSGTPFHEIAVLLPTNWQASVAERLLRARSIPVFTRSVEYPSTQVTMMIEGLAAWAVHGRQASGVGLGELLLLWSRLCGGSVPMSQSVGLVDLLLRAERSSELPASEFVRQMLNAGLSDCLSFSGKEEELRSVKEMMNELTGGSISDWSVAALGTRALKTDRVEVTTMTASKGLEFDFVLILGADDGQVPFFSADKDPTEMAEEMRKFYVSLTRARRRVMIFYSGFVEWRSGRVSAAGPSRFLKRLDVLRSG